MTNDTQYLLKKMTAATFFGLSKPSIFWIEQKLEREMPFPIEDAPDDFTGPFEVGGKNYATLEACVKEHLGITDAAMDDILRINNARFAAELPIYVDYAYARELASVGGDASYRRVTNPKVYLQLYGIDTSNAAFIEKEAFWETVGIVLTRREARSIEAENPNLRARESSFSECMQELAETFCEKGNVLLEQERETLRWPLLRAVMHKDAVNFWDEHADASILFGKCEIYAPKEVTGTGRDGSYEIDVYARPQRNVEGTIKTYIVMADFLYDDGVYSMNCKNIITLMTEEQLALLNQKKGWELLFDYLRFSDEVRAEQDAAFHTKQANSFSYC